MFILDGLAKECCWGGPTYCHGVALLFIYTCIWGSSDYDVLWKERTEALAGYYNLIYMF